MSSRSFADALGTWVRTRMPVARFAPVVALLAGAAAAAGTPTWTWAIGACVAALGLVFQFRLWDDLADSQHDRVHHPERILPQCESTAVFRYAAGTACVVNLLLVSVLSGTIAVAGLIALNAAYAVWYARPPRERSGLVAAHLVVLKYPAFAALIAPPPVDRAALALVCTALYFAFSSYELIHDRAHRAKRLAPGFIAAELAALAAALAVLFIGSPL